MLTFNAILRLYGLDPAAVRLVRHAEHRRRSDGTTVQARVIESWRNNAPAFELYQRLQGTAIFGDRAFGAIFLAMPDGKTLFAGLWRVKGVKRNTERLCCSITENDAADLFLYDLERLSQLVEFEGRLMIEWGTGTRAWSQLADAREKRVIAIMDRRDPPFPGWGEFNVRIDEVPALPASWQAVLSSVRGIYILVHHKTGRQYVGSATGDGGFLARWLDYARNGHGGNVELTGMDPSDLIVSVLESASSSASESDVLRQEAAWKRKLGSRVHGLNSN